jgi:hypothetical protein
LFSEPVTLETVLKEPWIEFFSSEAVPFATPSMMACV